MLTHTQANGGIVTNTYDNIGLKKSTKGPNGKITTFDYDSLDRLSSVTDALGNSWVYEYDDFKRITLAADPLGNTTTSTYAAPWEPVLDTVTLPSGRKTKFVYDANLRQFPSQKPMEPATRPRLYPRSTLLETSHR
ncbi:MAG TPA: hypothetical protein VIT91_07180 [Chthoniobacterales bacterium]